MRRVADEMDVYRLTRFWVGQQIRLGEVRPGDEDDFGAEAQLQALEAYRRYDPEKGLLSSFLYTCLRQWTWHGRKSFQRQYRRPPESSLTDFHGEGVDFEPAAAPLIAEDIELDERSKALLDMLPSRIRDTAEHHLAYGASLRDTADLLGLSDRTVLRHANKAREIWRAELAPQGQLARSPSNVVEMTLGRTCSQVQVDQTRRRTA